MATADEDMVDELDMKKEELENEEERILRELQELSEQQAVHTATPVDKGDKAEKVDKAEKKRASSGPGRTVLGDQGVEAARAALNGLIAECEKGVRDCKGYVADAGPPMKIVLCKPDEPIPAHATFISRPKNTGVDFTVPVKVPGYNTIIKNPITLNQIRDKCKHNKYEFVDEYLNDMKLLHRNTAKFNVDPDVQWIVRHAELLLEAAENAVSSRKALLDAAMEDLENANARQLSKSTAPATPSAGKRKRESTSNGPAKAHHGAAGQLAHADDALARHGSGRRGGRGHRIENSALRRKTDTNDYGVADPEGGRGHIALQLDEMKSEIIRRMNDICFDIQKDILQSQTEIENVRRSVENMNKSIKEREKGLFSRIDAIESQMDAVIQDLRKQVDSEEKHSPQEDDAREAPTESVKVSNYPPTRAQRSGTLYDPILGDNDEETKGRDDPKQADAFAGNRSANPESSVVNVDSDNEGKSKAQETQDGVNDSTLQKKGNETAVVS
mmetsp:Transcript_914/g.2891  ORF Transcript_914/g.2891 Transcript_914/m.2891 type:complete len:501 (-) Transcript_914:894-2396(-)|eukprot:CAMPEP_0198732082 /NCGR_PEP_ID=MMETSP1475-20131203/33764_1 /TAXON_ID= ORGANISM="Unidentified sp., Strain CCMP1999" /NCGR_SAMPLE_ID=MMETSP1475 /ASSEMBLY_ACC=CAM_ASM_001111 /LENGTH=500 /DNA_ID=CAMNT_0044495125 /DNA_START=78 /DNA_END=1583 /DNA_ORIENTATION=+